MDRFSTIGIAVKDKCTRASTWPMTANKTKRLSGIEESCPPRAKVSWCASAQEVLIAAWAPLSSEPAFDNEPGSRRLRSAYVENGKSKCCSLSSVHGGKQTSRRFQARF